MATHDTRQANREALLEALRHAHPRSLDALEDFRPRVPTAHGPTPTENAPSLCGELRETAGQMLLQAEAGTDVGALELAIERAQAVRLASTALDSARTRLSVRDLDCSQQRLSRE